MNVHRWGLALATAILFAATACGGGDDQTVGDPGTTSTATVGSAEGEARGTLEDAVLPADSAGPNTSGTITTGEVGVGTTTGTTATGTTGSVPPQP